MIPRILLQKHISNLQEWRIIPRHPTIDKPGRNGKVGNRVTTLHPYNDRILVGYGDWNVNTGPVDIWSFDPINFDWAQHAENIDSEAVDRFITMGDEVIALHADPLGYYAWDGCTPATIVSTGKSTAQARILHASDGIMLPDGSWWIVGSGWSDDSSKYNVPLGLLSKDKGQSWEHYTVGKDIIDHPDARFLTAGYTGNVPFASTQAHYPNWFFIDDNGKLTPDFTFPSVMTDKYDFKRPFKESPIPEEKVSARLEHNNMRFVGDNEGNIFVKHLPK